MTTSSSRCRMRVFPALALMLAVAGGCDASGRDAGDSATISREPVPEPVARRAGSPMADTVPLQTLIMWDAAGAQSALVSAGLQPRVVRTELESAGLRNGVALGVGDAEVHLFFLGDIAAADAAYRQIDVRRLRSVQPTTGEPSAMINNNMLAITFGGDPSLRQRIVRALHPGSEGGPADQVEP